MLIDKAGGALSTTKDAFSPQQAVGGIFGGKDYVYVSDTTQKIADRYIENENALLKLAEKRNNLELQMTDDYKARQKEQADLREKELLDKQQLAKEEADRLAAAEAAAQFQSRVDYEYYISQGKIIEVLRERAIAEAAVAAAAKLRATETSKVEIERNRLRQEWIQNDFDASRGFQPGDGTAIAQATEETTDNLEDMGRAITDLGSGLVTLNSELGRTVYGIGNVVQQLKDFDGSLGSTFSLSGGLLSIGQSIGNFISSRIGGGDTRDPLVWETREFGAFTSGVEGAMRILKQFERTLNTTFGEQHLGALQQNISYLGNELDALRLFASRSSGEMRDNLNAKIWELEDRFISLQQEEKRLQEDNLRAAFAAEKQRLTDLYSAEMIVLNERLSATQQIITDLTAGVTKLQAAKERMFPTSVADASAQIAMVLGQARRGDFSGLGGIDNALNAVTGMGTSGYSSSVDYERDRMKNYRMISELESLASGQKSIEERSLSALEQLAVDTEKRWTDEMDRMNAQLNALLGINTAVMSVADAIRQWVAYSVVTPPPDSGTPTTFTGGINPDWISTGGATGPTVPTYSDGDQVEGYSATAPPAARVPGGSPSAYIKRLLLDMSPDEVRDHLMNMYGTTFGYASGGFHPGGLRVVGERGPELEFTGPSRIVSNSNSKKLLDTSQMENEVKQLRSEISQLRFEFRQLLRIHSRWDGDGIPAERVTT
jgi:hypothetical protein